MPVVNLEHGPNWIDPRFSSLARGSVLARLLHVPAHFAYRAKAPSTARLIKPRHHIACTVAQSVLAIFVSDSRFCSSRVRTSWTLAKYAVALGRQLE